MPDNSNPNRARDHLANERTYLAWVRTGVATIVFGFAVGRFSIALREFMKLQGYGSTTPGLTTWLGIISAVGGVLLDFCRPGTLQANQDTNRFGYIRACRRFDRSRLIPARPLWIGAGRLSRVHRCLQQMKMSD